MIAVDSSAVVAVAFSEPGADDFLKLLAENPCVIGAPTRLEAEIVVGSRGVAGAHVLLAGVLALPTLQVIGFGIDHALLARDAYARYGKGRGHPAQLNFGDCMAYAVAKRDDLPLLYKGDDFARTNLRPARSTA